MDRRRMEAEALWNAVQAKMAVAMEREFDTAILTGLGPMSAVRPNDDGVYVITTLEP